MAEGYTWGVSGKFRKASQPLWSKNILYHLSSAIKTYTYQQNGNCSTIKETYLQMGLTNDTGDLNTTFKVENSSEMS